MAGGINTIGSNGSGSDYKANAETYVESLKTTPAFEKACSNRMSQEMDEEQAAYAVFNQARKTARNPITGTGYETPKEKARQAEHVAKHIEWQNQVFEEFKQNTALTPSVLKSGLESMDRLAMARRRFEEMHRRQPVTVS